MSSFLKDFLSGGAGGMCLVVVGHPFDTIKVRVQTAAEGTYKGVVDCTSKTIAEGGAGALYRGVFPVLAGVTPMYALCFLGYGVGKDIWCDEDAFTAENQKLFQIGMAGATSAAFTTPILAPGERIKCLQQTDKTGKFSGSFMNTVKHCYAEGGIKGVTKGFAATFCRDAVASMFYFSTYEFLKRKFADMEGLERGSTPSTLSVLCAGGFAGIFNWAGCLPIDTLKSRYQIAPMGQYSGAVFGSKSVLKEIIEKDGLMSLYKGATPVFLRAFPANAACFYGMETARSVLTKMGL